MKKLLCFICAAGIALAGTTVSAAELTPHLSVNSYDKNCDYTAKIKECLNDGGKYAMEVGAIYEKQRNLKIDTLKLDYEKTTYFDTYDTAEEILEAMEPKEDDSQQAYTEEDLYWLSRVIFAEGGCDWFPDWVQQGIASVVLNRVNDPRYPNTIKDVLFDPGQYGCVNNGSIYRTPTEKCLRNARYVLENGSTLPSYVIGQSGYPLGPVYSQYYDSVLGTTIYFFSC